MLEYHTSMYTSANESYATILDLTEAVNYDPQTYTDRVNVSYT